MENDQWAKVGKQIGEGIVEDGGTEALYYAIFEKPNPLKKIELSIIRKALREIHKKE